MTNIFFVDQSIFLPFYEYIFPKIFLNPIFQCQQIDIVDKTASFVARNGPEFETRIRQNELGNPKFNFLSAGDPYHAYYQHKVKEIRDGKSEC